MPKYIIVSHSGNFMGQAKKFQAILGVLQAQVNSKRDAGYKPIGGISIDTNGIYVYAAQAMELKES